MKKRTFEEVEAECHERGIRLLTTADEFQGCKRITIECTCGQPYSSTYYEIITAGKRCQTCKMSRCTAQRAENPRQYRNYRTWLEDHGYEMITTLEEFLAMRDAITNGHVNEHGEVWKSIEITFRCQNNHVTTLGNTSYANKKLRAEKYQEDMCTECAREPRTTESIARACQRIEAVFSQYGHTLDSYDHGTRAIDFTCGKCTKQSRTFLTNITKEAYKGYCGFCQPSGRSTDAEVYAVVENMGMCLVEYDTNKNVSTRCNQCPARWDHLSLHDLRTRVIKHFHCADCTMGLHGKTVAEWGGYCFRCYCRRSPENTPAVERFKKKESLFVQSLHTFFRDNQFSQILSGPLFGPTLRRGDMMRRPDAIIYLEGYNIVIECDEDEHRRYDGEVRRIYDLLELTEQKPLVVLRFNPDGFTDENGTYIPGCFQTTSDIVDEATWNKRVQVLLDRLRYYICSDEVPMHVVDHLFYSKTQPEVRIEAPIVRHAYHEPRPSTRVEGPLQGGHWHGGKLINPFRHVTDEFGPFIEVMLKDGLILQCEVSHWEIAREWTWSPFRMGKENLTRAKTKQCPHGNLFGKIFYPDFGTVRYLDGNGLNNRAYNVAKGNANGRGNI